MTFLVSTGESNYQTTNEFDLINCAAIFVEDTQRRFFPFCRCCRCCCRSCCLLVSSLAWLPCRACRSHRVTQRSCLGRWAQSRTTATTNSHTFSAALLHFSLLCLCETGDRRFTTTTWFSFFLSLPLVRIRNWVVVVHLQCSFVFNNFPSVVVVVVVVAFLIFGLSLSLCEWTTWISYTLRN